MTRQYHPVRPSVHLPGSTRIRPGAAIGPRPARPGAAWLLALLVAWFPPPGLAGPAFQVTAFNPNAVYRPGETIEWRVQALDPAVATVARAGYVIREAGARIIGRGGLDFSNGVATLKTSLAEPGTVLAVIMATNRQGASFDVLAGAAVAPERIAVSAPCPSDFDAFWQAKLQELAAVPADPVLTPVPSGRSGVDYWKIGMNNIRGTHIEGQLARPSTGEKFPAILIVQWAGVYPLQPAWVTDRAAQGWLALNLMAHDLPIDAPPAFYARLARGALANYPAIGHDDRETSYFLRMFLSCRRAVDYLCQRPDWDGRTLVVTGASQGGLQSFVTAALDHRVTAVMALVPAGCDATGGEAGRKPGWPDWIANTGTSEAARVRATARYFDGVNFAARVTCPALVGLGLVDTTSPPSGVFAAINQLAGTKELVIMPDSDHQGANHTQAPFFVKSTAWTDALARHQPLP